MDPAAEKVANALQSVVSARGVRGAVESAMMGLLSICERQELHAAVVAWGEDNTLLSLPPLGSFNSDGKDKGEAAAQDTAAQSRKLRKPSDVEHGKEHHTPDKQPLKPSLPRLNKARGHYDCASESGVESCSSARSTTSTPRFGGALSAHSRRHGSQGPNGSSRSGRILQAPPWLSFASLPNDATVSTEGEVEAFADFISPTEAEKSARAFVRTSVQNIVQLLVSYETTVKIIGGWANGFATFNSALDLLLSDPGDPLNVLTTLHRVLCGLGVQCNFKDHVGGFRVLQVCALSLADSQRNPHDTSHVQGGGAGPLAQGSAVQDTAQPNGSPAAHGQPPVPQRPSANLPTKGGEGTEGTPASMKQSPEAYHPMRFMVNIFPDRASTQSQPRLTTLKISSRLAGYSQPHRKLALTLKYILVKTNTSDAGGGVTGYLVMLIILAFFDHCSGHERFADVGWTLRSFLTFYASFDFSQWAISATSTPHNNAQAKGCCGQCIVGNVPGAMCDLSPQSGMQCVCLRRPSYFPNPSMSAQLFIMDGPKNLAESVTKLAPLTATVKYLSMLVQRYDADPRGTPLTPNLIACTPQMHARLSAWVQSGIPPSKQMAFKVLHSMVEYLGCDDTERDGKLLTACLTSPDFIRNAVDARGGWGPFGSYGNRIDAVVELLRLQRTDPQGAPLVNNVKVAIEKPCTGHVVVTKNESAESSSIHGTDSDDGDGIPTAAIALKAAEEAAEYVEGLRETSPAKHAAFIDELIGPDGTFDSRNSFSTALHFFNTLRRNNPKSIFRSVPEESLGVMTKIFLEFSSHPEVKPGRRRAVAACITKKFALTVAKDLLRFVSDPANASLCIDLLTKHAASPEEMEMALLKAHAEAPNTRLVDFRGDEADIRYFKELCKPFADDKEIKDVQQQIALKMMSYLTPIPPPAAAPAKQASTHTAPSAHKLDLD